MRVDSLASAAVDDLLSISVNKESSSSAVPTASQAPQDRTTLMSGSVSVASLTEQAMQSGTERSQKVQSLQESVNNGEYTVNAAKIADAMTTVIY